MPARMLISACILYFGAWLFPNPIRADQAFTYPQITEPILSATFNADLAALVANPTVSGIQVNKVQLMGPAQAPLDLSGAFFGEVPYPGIPQINLGPLETKIISADIPASFFPALATGSVGYSLLFTQTGNNGLFAITSLSLSITTPFGVTDAFVGPNDGFGIGIPPDGNLPAPLPVSIGIGVTGTGFDEAITSKALTASPVPEPSALLLFSAGLLLLFTLQTRYRKAAGCILLLFCLAAGSRNGLADAKTITCVSGQNNDGYLANLEGYARQTAGANDKIIRGTTRENFKDCLAMVQDGDHLVIVAHSVTVNDHHGAKIKWGGSYYSDFGSLDDQLPVPDDFASRMGVTITFYSCFSDCMPAPNTPSLCDRLKAKMGPNNTCMGFKGDAVDPAEPDLKGPSQDAVDKAAKCLEANENWENNPPANRPGTGGSGQPANQQTAAQNIVNACEGAAGVTVTITYSKPADEAAACPPIPQNLLISDPSETDIVCGSSSVGFPESPSQCHVVGPVPNKVPAGQSSSVSATVQALLANANGVPLTPISMAGVPDQMVSFTNLLGTLSFANGTVSGNGRTTTLPTDANGRAIVRFTPLQPGLILIGITVKGTQLSAYSLMTAF